MHRLLLPLLLMICPPALAEVVVDVDALGEGLGGWKARKGQAAEYQISDASYRTYRPEISPSPDGGIYVSVRIDHRRGFLASDDHASLELSFAADGTLVSAQSSLALQGRTITSELIKGGSSAATNVAAPSIDRAVKVGSDLVADLSAKILREKIIEPGRVSFPAAIRHNYNLIYLAVKPKPVPATPAVTSPVSPSHAPQEPASSPSPPAPPASPSTPAPSAQPAPSPAPPAPAAPPSPAPTGPPAPPAGTPPPPPGSTPPAAPAGPAAATGPKPIPLPEVKPYDPGRAAVTPLPPPKEKSLLMQHGDEVLKLARQHLQGDKR